MYYKVACSCGSNVFKRDGNNFICAICGKNVDVKELEKK